MGDATMWDILCGDGEVASNLALQEAADCCRDLLRRGVPSSQILVIEQGTRATQTPEFIVSCSPADGHLLRAG
jgi:hypothetical protein